MILQRPPGPMTEGLQALAHQHLTSGTVMVEVGSHQGESAEIFINTGLVKTITCVDPLCDFYAPDFETHPVWKGNNDWEFCAGRTTYIVAGAEEGYFIRKPSAEVAATWPDSSLDFVYIDAFHEYASVLQDIKLWLPKLKAGGVMAGHDYTSEFNGVIRAVNEVFGKPDKTYADSSWVVRLRT